MRKIMLNLFAVALFVAALPAPSLAAASDHTYTQFLCVDPDTSSTTGGPDSLTVSSSSSLWSDYWPGGGCKTLSPRDGGRVPQGTWVAMTYEITDPALSIVSAQHWDYLRDLSSEGGMNLNRDGLVLRQHGSTNLGSTSSLPVGTDVFSATGQQFVRGNPGNVFSSANRFATTTDPGRSRWSVSVICNAPAGCYDSGDGWHYEFIGAQIRIADYKAPDVSAATLEDGPVRRELWMALRAADEGGGLYRVVWTVDGQSRPPVLIGRGGLGGAESYQCRDVNPSNGDPYEFANVHSCAPSVDLRVDFDIMDLSEGAHRFRAQVEDAAGNAVSILDRDLVVDNYPDPHLDSGWPGGPTYGPTISGTPAIGSQLTGYPGGWADPASWEPAHLRSYGWERCDVNDVCQTIPGATSSVYTPTSDDGGYRLRHSVTETNSIGETHTERSAMTDTIPRASTSTPDQGGNAPGGSVPGGSAPGGSTPGGNTPAGNVPGGSTPGGSTPGGNTPAGNAPGGTVPGGTTPVGPGLTPVQLDHAKLTVAFGKAASTRTRWAGTPRAVGRLTTSSGAPLAGAKIIVQSAEARPGARAKQIGVATTGTDGRFTFTVAHGPSRNVTFAAGGQQVTLRTIVPASVLLKVRHARQSRAYMLTGRLAHLGRSGIRVEVQALDGKRWRTFDTTTTRKGGSFRYAYRFKKSALGRRFALRLLVASPVYPFARGSSSAAWIRVTR